MTCDSGLTPRPGPRRILALGAAGLVVVLTSLLGTAAVGADDTQARAVVTPSVTIDPATLPPGPPPNMPYFDVATEQIRDGARVVDLTGLQRFDRPEHLWKVGGGYVLDRYLEFGDKPYENQLLLISNSGRATILSRHLSNLVSIPLVVSSQYGRVAYAEYADRKTTLVVNDVPSGKRVSTRNVQTSTQPVAYRGRVLARHFSRAFYWTPGVTAVETDHRLDSLSSIDMRAAQVAFREGLNTRVAPYPPGSGTGWTEEKLDYGTIHEAPVLWSTDSQHLAGASYDYENGHAWEVLRVRRASDGAPVIDIAAGDSTRDGIIERVWWESADTALVRIGNATVRCTTTGVCNRIGAMTPIGVVPVTRNVS